MSNQPPPTPPPVQPLNYAPPAKGPSVNKWWMVCLRILGGIFAGGVSGVMGLMLAQLTTLEVLFFLPPGMLLAAFIVVAVKFRRFGYVTGFLLAPFVAAAVFAVFMLIIIIIVHKRHHP